MPRKQIPIWPTLFLCSLAAVAEPPEKSTGSVSSEALAKQTQNPVANLISFPLQNNFNFGLGQSRVTQWVMNVQPVIPVPLSTNWNLITRTVLPVIDQPSIAPGVPSAFGLGDLNPTFFVSPAGSKGFIWGAGPTFTLPTATDRLLGQQMWCAGPAVVGLTMQGPWVAGALAHQQWSFAGWGTRPVNGLLIQPFINYHLPDGWYLSSSPILTANWEEPAGQQWTVPVGGGGGKIVHLGRLPLNLSLAAFYNVETPQYGSTWQLRFTVQMLFPR